MISKCGIVQTDFVTTLMVNLEVHAENLNTTTERNSARARLVQRE